MGLILRVDVDKPYGRDSGFDKIKSKLREDYFFPRLDALGYLKACARFIEYCNKNGVQGVFYFRNCTSPNENVGRLLIEGKHQLGFHAENTRTSSTFLKELNSFRDKNKSFMVNGFTKHGSGDIKIGRTHYPPFEPEKYKVWAAEYKLEYFFGNEICHSESDFSNRDSFFPKMFWIHKDYRGKSFNTLEEVVSSAKEIDIPVIIHPSNFTAEPFVQSEFKKLIALAKEHNVPWVLKHS